MCRCIALNKWGILIIEFNQWIMWYFDNFIFIIYVNTLSKGRLLIENVYCIKWNQTYALYFNIFLLFYSLLYNEIKNNI